MPFALLVAVGLCVPFALLVRAACSGLFAPSARPCGLNISWETLSYFRTHFALTHSFTLTRTAYFAAPAAIFCRRCVVRIFDSLFRTAMA